MDKSAIKKKYKELIHKGKKSEAVKLLAELRGNKPMNSEESKEEPKKKRGKKK